MHLAGREDVREVVHHVEVAGHIFEVKRVVGPADFISGLVVVALHTESRTDGRRPKASHREGADRRGQFVESIVCECHLSAALKRYEVVRLRCAVFFLCRCRHHGGSGQQHRCKDGLSHNCVCLFARGTSLSGVSYEY